MAGYWLSPTERASVSADFGLPGYAPGTIAVNVTYTDGERIQCWSNASQHIPIYLQPFTSIARYWSEIATFSYLLAFNAIPGKSLILRKLESWGYQTVKTV